MRTQRPPRATSSNPILLPRTRTDSHAQEQKAEGTQVTLQTLPAPNNKTSHPPRLDRQHALWSRNLGYDLHPSISSPVPPTARIAEIACGTGSFLQSLSNTLPSTVAFHGYDISAALFPPSLNANVTLDVHDAKTPFPERLHTSYDIVHIRLLACAMDKPDWEPVTRNAAQLLKPGGALQWEEADFPASSLVRGADPECSLTAMTNLFGRLGGGVGGRLDGWKQLPGAFERAGLLGTQHDCVSSDRVAETRRDVAEVSLEAVRGVMAGEEGARRTGKTVEEVASMFEAVQGEIEGGAYNRYDIHVFVGFKAG